LVIVDSHHRQVELSQGCSGHSHRIQACIHQSHIARSKAIVAEGTGLIAAVKEPDIGCPSTMVCLEDTQELKVDDTRVDAVVQEP
jgi:hypothetical protein